MFALAMPVLLLGTLATALQPIRAAATSWQTPGFVRSIGGAGPAGVYAWGIAYNPITSEIEVADYWNFYIRHYSLTGHQNGSFYQSAAARKGQPESLAVDPRNGDVFVAENGKTHGYIARFDKNGNYLSELNTGSDYTAWITIDDFGHLIIVNGHLSASPHYPNQVQVYDPDNYQLIRKWGTYGSGPGQFIQAMGLATDANGNVFVNDAVNKRVSEFDPYGKWIRDFGSAGSGMGHFSGDLRGMAIDQANGWVYVVDAQGAKIEKFDATNGNSLLDWGSQGTGNGQFRDGGRQVTVDGSGNVWVADYSNFRIQEFTSSGQFMAAYPNPAQPPIGGYLSEARDVAVNPGDGSVWVADVWSDRFQKFSSNGTFEGSWGYRGNPAPYGFDYPRGIGVDPATGNVWVADTRAHRIRIYDEGGNYITTLGSGAQSCSAGSFAAPVDIQFYNGRAYISDYWCGNLQILDAGTGNQVGNIYTYNNGSAIDPATGNIYIVDEHYHVVREYDSSGRGIRTIGSSGSGSNQFTSPWADDILNGFLYVTDQLANRVQVFDLNGNWVGQLGSQGPGTFQFNQPSGITHDAAGNLYIADANNDRIQVFNSNVPMPSGDTTPPSMTMSSPVKGQVFPAVAVIIAGTAADDLAVGEVQVAVHDATTTNMWWDAGHSTWQARRVWNIAAFVCTAPGSCSWSSDFIGEQYGGSYSAQVQVLDTSGHVTTGTVVRFTVSAS
jgi:DNA-binding beta-propeller fold protein YncE